MSNPFKVGDVVVPTQVMLDTVRRVNPTAYTSYNREAIVISVDGQITMVEYADGRRRVYSSPVCIVPAIPSYQQRLHALPDIPF